MWLTICTCDWHHFRNRIPILISLENLQLYASVVTLTAAELLISSSNSLNLGNQDLQVSRAVPTFHASELHRAVYTAPQAPPDHVVALHFRTTSAQVNCNW